VPDNPRIEDLRRRVQRDPASIAFAQLAEEYRRAGQFQEAVDACCAGLVLHPGYLSARVTLGRALLELGDLDQAQRELETVLKTAPENLAAIRGIADIHYKRGALSEALEFYRTAHGLARNDPELEQIVADLAQRVTPTRRGEPKEGLSLDQMQREIGARPPHPTPPTLRPKAVDQSQVAPNDSPGQPPSGSTMRRPAPAPPLALRLPAGADSRSPRPRADALAEPDAPLPDSPVAPARSEPGDARRERSLRVVAALEQWLAAIHVTRANRAT
jgi:tetratricopeptide (TPR) repeat protein